MKVGNISNSPPLWSPRGHDQPSLVNTPAQRGASRKPSISVPKGKTDVCAGGFLRSRHKRAEGVCKEVTRGPKGKGLWAAECSGTVDSVLGRLVALILGNAFLSQSPGCQQTGQQHPRYQDSTPSLPDSLSTACWTCICRGLPFLEHTTWKKYFPSWVSLTYST